jgi:prepilin-type N-terminal cleavage/methylation domain-containing protein/prepilin-type processing-associated H-X9-DG protein
MMRWTDIRRRRASLSGSARARGFTLVELLVVIVIVAILATLVFVMTRRVMDSAKATRNMANLRSLASQIQSFAADQGYYPPGFDTNFPNTSSFTKNRWPEILMESSGAKPPREEYLSPTKGSKLEPGMTWQPINYATNVAVCYRTGGQRVRPANIQRPGETVLLGDVTTQAGAESTPHKNGFASFTPKGATLTADTPALGQQDASFWTGAGTGQPEYRNSGKAHMVFVDGHLEAFKEDELKAKHFSIKY